MGCPWNAASRSATAPDSLRDDTVALDHDQLGPFERGEAFTARQALAPAADGHPVVDETRIDDLRLVVVTELAVHASEHTVPSAAPGAEHHLLHYLLRRSYFSWASAAPT